jgi:lysophospholipase L1-like esterase
MQIRANNVPTLTSPKPRKRFHETPVLVAVGDSLTAGMQDATLDLALQKKSFSSLIARQSGLDFQVPEIHGGAIPPKLFEPGEVPIWRTLWSYAQVGLAGAGPVALAALGVQPPALTLLPLYHVAGMGKQKGPDDTHNFAVPGFELRHLNEVANVSDFTAAAARGEEDPLFVPVEAPLVKAILQKGEREKAGKTEIDLAVEKQPDLVTLWAGNNDILFTALMGNVDDQSLTPIEDRQWLLNPGQGKPKYTERVMPGLKSSMVGPNGSLTRLLKETDAEVMLMNIPDVTTIPHLLTVGEKVGSLPFEVVLPDGTDITKKLEEFRIPNGVYGAKDGERTSFPEGTRVGLGFLLTTLYRLLGSDNGAQDTFALQSGASLLSEDEVLDPDEVAQVQEHTREFNAILSEASKNSRVHLVDVNRALGQARDGGYSLRGAGPQQKVGSSFTGVKGADGQEGLFSYDGVHPSDVGQAVVANLILDVAKEELADDPRFEKVVQAPLIDEKAVLEADPRREAKRPRLVLADRLPGLLGGFGANSFR